MLSAVTEYEIDPKPVQRKVEAIGLRKQRCAEPYKLGAKS
jgi:hypothetical protein